MSTQLAHLLEQTVESYRNVNPNLETREKGWEKWYAYWLLNISDIREYLSVEPTPATLEKLLIQADSKYAITPTTQTWSQFTAREIELIVSRYSRTKHNK